MRIHGISINTNMKMVEILTEHLEDSAIAAARHFGTEIEEMGYIGAGEWGQAYYTVDNRVIKITTSRDEAKAAKHLAGKKIPNVIQIYSVMRVKEGWAIYQELLDTDGIEDVYYAAEHDMEENSEEDYISMDTMEDFDMRDAHALPDPEVGKFIQDIQNGMYMARLHAHVPNIDLAPDNIGRRNKEYVVFDIMSKTFG